MGYLRIDTQEQIAKVVRIYELRWLIESFFNYLKSGFEIEDLRYDSFSASVVKRFHQKGKKLFCLSWLRILMPRAQGTRKGREEFRQD